MEVNRTGSADSENGSSDSYVQISKEDAQGGDYLSGVEAEVNREDEDVSPPSGDAADKSDLEVPAGREEERVARVPSVEDVTKQEVAPDKSPMKPLIVAPGLLSYLNVLPCAVLYLIFWKEPKLSAVVLGGILVTLLTLTLNTFIHTMVLFLLSFLVVSLTYIVIKIALDSFYNRPIRNPFSDYLREKIVLPQDKVAEWVVFLVQEFNCIFNILARLLMFDNIKQTFKFGITLWLLSFVTNHITLLRALFFGVIVLFTVPPIYVAYQKRIDDMVGMVQTTVIANLRRILSKIPYLKEKLQ